MYAKEIPKTHRKKFHRIKDVRRQKGNTTQTRVVIQIDLCEDALCVRNGRGRGRSIKLLLVLTQRVLAEQ